MSQVNPIQFTPLTKADLDDPNLGFLNQVLTQFANGINAGNGAMGKTVLPSGIDVKGATVSGVGEPQAPTDAVSKGHAEKNYSAAALAPQLEGSGKYSLKTMRRLGDTNQQESSSTYLNLLSNTTPTANTSIVTATPPSGGSVTFTVSAGFHQRMDGTIASYGTFTDTVALPSSQAITTLTRTSGVVTATGTFTGLSAGQSIYELGASDPSFDGTFVLLTASGTTLTWNQTGFANGTATGGAVSTGGVYMVYLKNPSVTLAVSGPFPQDAQTDRLESNIDQQVLIAVAVISASGLVVTQSAGGATPPATTNGNRILARL
jgi:hypothetical protein